MPFKNTYELGDNVITPFGVGTITKDLGIEHDDRWSDHMFVVHVGSKDYKVGSFEIHGHAK